jgi:hypothetical protein
MKAALKRMISLTIVLSLYAMPALSRCGESDTGIAASPSRPIESSSPDPVRTGVAQVELGYTRTFFQSGGGQNGIPNLLKLGLWCDTEVRWSTSALFSVPNGGATSSGIGDQYFAAQYRFVHEARRRPSTAIGYSFKAPTARPSDGLGSGFADHALTLMLGKTVHGFSTVANATCFFIGESGGSSTKGEWTLATTHALKGRYSMTAEFFGDSGLNRANQPYAVSTWVLSYGRSPRLVFDLGGNVALSSGPGAPGHSVFAGVTYAFANVYD